MVNDEIYYEDVQSLLHSCADQNIESKLKFFKSFPGGYGEGDQFIGVTVPNQRLIAKEIYPYISTVEWQKVMSSPFHEMRLTAIFVLVIWFEKSKNDWNKRQQLVDLYLKHLPFVNNWDLVDSSTYKILGPYVEQFNDWALLNKLAQSESIWEKRVAVVALHYLFSKGFFQQGLDLISINIEHPHDLMQKANGWMLKVLGEYDVDSMMKYLKQNNHKISRTTLRYAIEKLDKQVRKRILNGDFDD